jgi:Phospholipase_D-nuclease N-terminal/Short C-terminal domain
MLAFSIWNALWVVIVTFVFVSILMALFSVIADLFRDREMSGWGKAAWIVVLVLLPLIGLLVYVIARGPGMAERAQRDDEAAKAEFDQYVREVAGGGAASELERAASLHAAGKLSDEEFAALKAKVLS